VSGHAAPVPAAAIAAPAVELPSWAEVGERRAAHIARVTALLDGWARDLALDRDEAAAWHDAGRWHDALRDAPEATLRSLAGDVALPVGVLHGPAAAARLEREGERRADVLEAVRWHTLGHPAWARTGRALYMADYLEPGRPFAAEERAALAGAVVADFESVFREVLRHRITWSLREGKRLYPETVELWNAVR
jgi:2-amino-4-hydroxy-6-hydroxymethyldihydropteridine diphosphokinase